MQRWMTKMRPLAYGGVTLGVLQGFQTVDFNQIWFQFLYAILNAIVSLLLGGDASSLSSSDYGSPFGSFF